MTGRVNGRSRALGTVPQDELRAAMTLWRAEREGVPGIARRRDARVADLRTHAAQRSRFYADHWTGVPADAPLAALPPVTKDHLMSRFDEWVTDPRKAGRAVLQAARRRGPVARRGHRRLAG